jgi:hypothetical protein
LLRKRAGYAERLVPAKEKNEDWNPPAPIHTHDFPSRLTDLQSRMDDKADQILFQPLTICAAKLSRKGTASMLVGLYTFDNNDSFRIKSLFL